MSADSIPYQLRPNKFIDRQLFVDLLGRLIPIVGNEKYVYVSMGGKHLADHRAVYRQLGVKHLFAFDADAAVVARQTFNKPIRQVLCQEMHSAALTTEIDNILSSFESVSNLIVWLDYTDPSARRSQLQEFIQILGRLQPDDIVRITLNANVGTLEKNIDDWKKLGFATRQEFRLNTLKDQLDDLVPTDINSIGPEDFPEVLARCVQLAVSHAESANDQIIFKPLLLTSYKDGQRMFTATLVAKAKGDSVDDSLSCWPFKAKNWSNLEYIEAPDLSAKERQKIDSYLNKAPSYILERLKFQLASSTDKSKRVIQSYKRFHRYYPDFRSVEF